MSSDVLVEQVPRLGRRAGDAILANENNSALILGRDRPGNVDSGYGDRPGSAAAHLVVGRGGTDPDPMSDAATLYLSSRTDPDSMAGTEGIGQSSTAVPGAFMRADCIRILPRKDLKISVGKAYLLIQSDGTIILDGSISLGEGAADRLLKGDSFSTFWSTLTIPTPVGPSGPPPPIPDSVFSSRPVRVR